jgi:cyanophycinase
MSRATEALESNRIRAVTPGPSPFSRIRRPLRGLSRIVVVLATGWISFSQTDSAGMAGDGTPAVSSATSVTSAVPTLTPFLNPPEIAARPPAGSLVLSGGGRIPDSVRGEFLKLAGAETARLVVIPTGSETFDDTDERAEHRRLWESFCPATVDILHTRSRDESNSESFVAPLRQATGVWIAGGRQTLIAASYSGTRVERELHALLERGGVIGGTSAGAACLSRIMLVRGDVYSVPGFGLLPGTIVDQHFIKRDRKARLVTALTRHPRWLGVGIDENTALVVRGGAIRCVGDSTVSLCLPPTAAGNVSELVLQPGDSADLNDWRRKAGQRMTAAP